MEDGQELPAFVLGRRGRGWTFLADQLSCGIVNGVAGLAAVFVVSVNEFVLHRVVFAELRFLAEPAGFVVLL